ncbi:MAG: hypothetical protein N4A35_05535 [Flavobacteriales bacterium]|jgi:hypothetical protein|nr:hypothetical protein [Flavobacteriales bacterium]
MKNKLLILILGLLPLWSLAQNPFEDIGIKVKVLTLSNGKYQEFFPNDTLRRVGSVMYNSVTGEIEYFVSEEQLRSEATATPYLVSRWFSRDPLAAKYPSMSPYNSMGNNPIFYVDGNGDSIYHQKVGNNTRVLVYIIDQDQVERNVSNKWANYLDIEGWDYIITDKVEDADNWLYKNYSSKLPQNLMIRQHSSYDEEGDLMTRGIYIQDEAETEDPATFKIGNVKAKSIRTLNYNVGAKELATINSYTKLFSYVQADGVLCLAFCGFAAKQDRSTEQFTLDLEKLANFHQFFQIAPTVSVLSSTNDISVSQHLDKQKQTLTPDIPNKSTPFNWVEFNGTGMKDMGFDLKINKGGFQKTSTQSTTGKSKNPRFL